MKYAEFKSGNHNVTFFCTNLTEEIVKIDGIVQSKSYIIQNKSHLFILNNELFTLTTKYNILSSGSITITLSKKDQIIDVKTVPLDKTQRFLWLGIVSILILWLIRIITFH